MGIGPPLSWGPHRRATVAAPGSRQSSWEGLDLPGATPLVIGEVPVEAVELVGGSSVEQALEGWRWVEVAGTVEEDAAKTEARYIPHRQAELGRLSPCCGADWARAHQSVSLPAPPAARMTISSGGDGEPCTPRGKCRLDEVDLRIVILGQGQACQLVEMGEQEAGERGRRRGPAGQPEVAFCINQVGGLGHRPLTASHRCGVPGPGEAGWSGRSSPLQHQGLQLSLLSGSGRNPGHIGSCLSGVLRQQSAARSPLVGHHDLVTAALAPERLLDRVWDRSGGRGRSGFPGAAGSWLRVKRNQTSSPSR